MVHFYRNVFSHVPAGKLREVALMLKAIHAQEDLPAAQGKAAEVVARLKDMRLSKAAELVETAVSETLAYYAFPEEHWRRIRTNNPLERIMREIRRAPAWSAPSPTATALEPGRGQAAPHRRHALVDQKISEHAAAQAAQRIDRLTRAGHRPKCEKFPGHYLRCGEAALSHIPNHVVGQGKVNPEIYHRIAGHPVHVLQELLRTPYFAKIA